MLVLLTSLLPASGRAYAAPVDWLPDADGSWTVPTNWSSNPSLPGPADDVTISVAGDRLITLSSSSQSVKSVLSNERLKIVNSTLTLGTTGQFNQTVSLADGTISGGTLSFGAGAGLSISINLSNRLVNVALTGPLSLAGGGTVRIAGTLTAAGGVDVANGFLLYEGAAPTAAAMTYAMNGGAVDGFNPGGPQTLTLAVGATVRGRGSLGSGAPIGSSASAVVNRGTIAADVAGGTLTVGPAAFTNVGDARADNGGTLNIAAASWTNPGAITATAGSTLTFSGAWDNAGTITATNATTSLGGTFTTAGLGAFNRSGGTVRLTGALNNAGATLGLNAATGSWSVNGGTITGGTIDQSGGAGLTFSNGTTNRLVDVAVTGGPLSLAGVGYLRVAGSLTAAGGVDVANGALLYEGAAPTAAAMTYALNNGAVNGFNPGGPQTLTLAVGATVRGRGELGTGGPFGSSANSTIVNRGTIAADVAGGTLSVGPSTFTNVGDARADNGGTLSIAAASWSNPGAITATAGSTLSFAGAWDNAGTVTATNATTSLGGTFTTAGLGAFSRTGGTVRLTGALNNAGATLGLNAATGSWSVNGGTITGGTVDQSGGAGLTFSNGTTNRLVDVAFTGSPLNLAGGGTVRIAGTLTAAGGVDVANGALLYEGAAPTAAPMTYALNNGAVNGLYLGSPQTLTLAVGATVRGRGSLGTGGPFGSTSAVVNRGTVAADVAGGTLTVGPSTFTNVGTSTADGGTLLIQSSQFVNSGVLQVNAGVLQIANNVSFSTTAGSSFVITGGTAQFDAAVTLPSLDLPIGTLAGSGNVTTPTLNWTGGGMAGTGKTTVAADATLTISGAGSKSLARTINNGGATAWTGGPIQMTGGTFNNLAAGIFNATAANSILNNGGTNLFSNAGAFSKTSSSISIIAVPFTNQAAGTVDVNDGTLVLSGGGTNFGTMTVAAGASLRLGSTFTHAAGSTLISHGNLDFNAAVIALDGNVTVDGELSFSTASATVKANATTNKLSLVNSTATVAAGGNLNVGAGGLSFGGAANNGITLQPSATTPGKLKLSGDVDFTGTAGTAAINTADFSVGQTPGLLDLSAATRTFTVADGSAAVDLAVSARLTNGQVTKAGAGRMRLDSPNAHASTLVTGGTLEAIDPAALGTGTVTLAGGNLTLKSDAAGTVNFGNALNVTADATVTVDRISVGTTGVLKLGPATIAGASRLSVAGANRTLELTGLTLGGIATLDAAVPLAITGPVTESAAGAGLTKSTGTAKLTLGGAAANTYSGLTRVNAGAVELNKPAGVTAVPGDLDVFGGSVKVLADQQVAATSNVSVNNAGTVLDLGGHSQAVASLAVVNANVTVGAGGSAVLRTKTLSVTGATGKLDLADNRLIVDYAAGGPSPLAGIRQMIAPAYAGGTWAGAAGLGSAAAAASPSRALGYAEASAVLGPGGGTFANQTVDGSAVLVRYTLAGDATLDGAVDFNDLVPLAQNYNVLDGQRTWADGDYTYDGNVDFNDLVKLAQNYNTTLGAAAVPGATPAFESDLAAAFAGVPEPSALIMALAVACGFVIRRGRRPA